MATTLCTTGEPHVWAWNGFCEDCDATQPDYEPDDANMPNLAAQTDTPDSPTYPWNQYRNLCQDLADGHRS